MKMVCVIQSVILIVIAGLASLSGEARSTQQNNYAAPWTEWSPPPYRNFVLTYAKGELQKAKTPVDRDKVAETILMSSADTYERYLAAKETGFGIRALIDDALSDVEKDLPAIANRKYFLRSTWEYYAYDASIGGFPVYSPLVRARAFDYENPEIKSGEYIKFDNNPDMQAALGRGMSLVAPGFQLSRTSLSLDLRGWTIPATQERAAELVRNLLKSKVKRTIGVIAVYTLSSCYKIERDLKCYGKIEKVYAYGDGRSIRADMPPLFELVWHEGNFD